MVALFGRQFVADADREGKILKMTICNTDDYVIPILTLVELTFYTGWLKTMTLLWDPMAVSAYAYNLPEIEDGVIGRAMTVFQVTKDAAIPPLDNTLHGFSLDHFQQRSSETHFMNPLHEQPHVVKA